MDNHLRAGSMGAEGGFRSKPAMPKPRPRSGGDYDPCLTSLRPPGKNILSRQVNPEENAVNVKRPVAQTSPASLPRRAIGTETNAFKGLVNGDRRGRPRDFATLADDCAGRNMVTDSAQIAHGGFIFTPFADFRFRVRPAFRTMIVVVAAQPILPSSIRASSVTSRAKAR